MQIKKGLFMLAALALAACSEVDQVAGPLKPQMNFASSVAVTLKLQLPDGSNPCPAFGGGSIRLQLLNPTTRQLAVHYNSNGTTANASRILTCPMSSTTYNVLPGDYDANFTLQTAGNRASFPRRWMEQMAPVTGATTVVSNLLPGQQLRGTVTLNGEVMPGVALSVLHTGYPQILTNITSTADHWVDALTAQPNVYLRAGEPVNITGCDGLGVFIQSPPTTFVVGNEPVDFNCALTAAPATQYTHDRTALVATVGPGDLGYQDPVDPAASGAGFGVQYPVGAEGPRHLPVNASHMFRGGLLVAVEPGIVLSATNVHGYAFDCIGPCRDFDSGAKTHMTAETPHGRTITWTYSDAGSAESVGLDVTQTSFDGRNGDYVLVRYTFHNKSQQSQTFYAGGFYDWDVDEDGTAVAEKGGTGLGGRLMWNVGNAGTHVGTMMISDFAPAGALHFLSAGRFTLPAQLDALRGTTRAETTARADARYIQSMGPITLKKGHKADVWVGLVAGRNQAELFQNAAAAEADATSRN